MKILVTGAYGQLGSTIKELSAQFSQWEFFFTDADSLDITDEKSVAEYFHKINPGFLINCAAYTAVENAEADIETARAVNTVAPGVLAEAAKESQAGFIHVSTDYVFDGKSPVPYRETDTVNPLGVYGATKLAGERRSLEVNSDTIIIRTSWLYSAYGKNFMKTILAKSNEGSLKVVFDQIGSPTWAHDLALAIVHIIKHSEEVFHNEIFHYSNEGVCSWYDFAKAILSIKGRECEVSPVLSSEFVTKAKRPHYSVLNKQKIKKTFGLTIPYWRDSLAECLSSALLDKH